jgi:hypothetical protein
LRSQLDHLFGRVAHVGSHREIESGIEQYPPARFHVGAFHAHHDRHFDCRSRAAATTPVASVSQRRMPPKMLISTAFTLESASRMRNAFFTWSALAPPPTSRKLAGLPPANWMMSMVAMARPAPFTMQPTVPSSLM